MARAAVIKRRESRIQELIETLQALRREQGLIIAELVWNEMRAWEIKGLLDARGDTKSEKEREALRKDLSRRSSLIRSLAQWERSADQSYRRQRAQLEEILGKSDESAEPGDGRAELLAVKGLDSIARAAAAELGLNLDGGVDGY